MWAQAPARVAGPRVGSLTFSSQARGVSAFPSASWRCDSLGMVGSPWGHGAGWEEAFGESAVPTVSKLTTVWGSAGPPPSPSHPAHACPVRVPAADWGPRGWGQALEGTGHMVPWGPVLPRRGRRSLQRSCLFSSTQVLPRWL